MLYNYVWSLDCVSFNGTPWRQWDMWSPRLYLVYTQVCLGFPDSSNGKEFACNAGDLGLIPGSGRSSGGGNSNPLQYSCLEIPMDRGAWQATVHGIAELEMTEQLTLTYMYV